MAEIKMYKHSRIMPSTLSNILVIGEVFYDRIPETPDPQAPTKLWLGGAPTNMAIGLTRRFPEQVFLLAGFSTDKLGRSAKLSVENFGIQTQYCIESDDPTRVFIVKLYENGEKSFVQFEQGVIPYADEIITPHDVRMAFEEVKPKLIYHGSLVAAKDDFYHALQEADALAKQTGTLRFMDVNLRPPFFQSKDEMLHRAKQLFQEVDVVKISDDEIRELYPQYKDNFQEALFEFSKDYPNIRLIFLTAGPMGSIALYKDTLVGEFKRADIQALDTTGAGDAYCAGATSEILDQLQQGKTLEDLDIRIILKTAEKNAQKSTQYFGAVSYVLK